MKLETIKERLKLSYDANTASLLIIPLVLCICIVFHNWVLSYDLQEIIYLSLTPPLPMVVVRYCYREDRSHFEKGLFIFFSLCALFMLIYYAFFSGHPAMDNFVKWMGIGLYGILFFLFLIFDTIWDINYKKISTTTTASIKIGKRPLEWGSLLFVIGAIVLINIWPS